jgi:hypothetical protein
MGFVNPIWLWGMLGLMIPVAIHLLSRKDMRIIRVGSLRHLEHATTRQAVRIHLNAFLLLALRCLIVAIVTLLLAGLYLINKNTTRWVLVDGNLSEDEKWQSLVDSLTAQGYEARRLQQGFPLLEDADANSSPPDYWTLAEQLSNLQLDRCIIISRDRFVGFVGERPRQDTNLTWLTMSPDSARFVLSTSQTAGDSVVMRVGRSNDIRTAFETLRLPASAEQDAVREWSSASVTRDTNATARMSETVRFATDSPPPVRVVLSGTSITSEERRVLSAAIHAIQANGIVPIEFKEVSPGETFESDWLIWLSADDPPERGASHIIRRSSDLPATRMLKTTNYRHGAPIIVRAEDDDNNPQHGGIGDKKVASSEALVSVNRWFITEDLTLSAAVRGEFTLQLATLLLGDADRQLNSVVRLHDRRQLPETETFATPIAGASPGITAKEPQRSARDVLAILLVVLLATERFIANRQQL